MSTHTGKVMVIAAGPGVLACAVMGVYEFGDGPAFIDLLGAYPLALLAFLPAIPVLAWTMVRAFPPREHSGARRGVSHIWLILSWCAPCWHVGALQLMLRSPVLDWGLVLRHSACLWFVTLCGWLGSSYRAVEPVERPHVRSGRRSSPPRGPALEGTIFESSARTAIRTDALQDEFL